MSNPDLGLANAVDAFIDTLMATLEPVADTTLRRSVDQLRKDLALDAFNCSAAFIDCDDSHSEPELEAFIVALEQHFPDLLPPDTKPADVRAAGLITGKRSWINEPSGLFNSLVASDQQSGTAYSSVYYEQALRMAHTAIGLDDYTSRFELSGVEQFRSMLLRTMKSGNVNSSASVATTGGPTTKAEEEEEIELPPRAPTRRATRGARRTDRSRSGEGRGQARRCAAQGAEASGRAWLAGARLESPPDLCGQPGYG